MYYIRVKISGFQRGQMWWFEPTSSKLWRKKQDHLAETVASVDIKYTDCPQDSESNHLNWFSTKNLLHLFSLATMESISRQCWAEEQHDSVVLLALGLVWSGLQPNVVTWEPRTNSMNTFKLVNTVTMSFWEWLSASSFGLTQLSYMIA